MTDRVLSKPELRQSKPTRAAFAALRRTPITVVLDGVTGNYNIGAIFRLCDAFLVERLVICARDAKPDTDERPLLRKRKLVQAAMGTQHWVPWRTAPDAAVVVRDAKRAGSWIGVVELTADSVSVAAMQPRFPAVLVLGNEHSGIAPDVLACADQAIAIPMLGIANSLNVATACAIVLHTLAAHAAAQREEYLKLREERENLPGIGVVGGHVVADRFGEMFGGRAMTDDELPEQLKRPKA